MTQEFHISITPVRNDEYWVRTEQVAPGVPLADEQFAWPVHDWLDQARHLMNDPLVGLLQGNGTNRMGSSASGRASDASPQEPTVTNLVDLGRLLYEALFQGRLRDSWMTAQGIAQHRGEVLRLRLGLKGSELPRLPWEVLNGGIHHVYAGSARPLATGTDILFSRYQPGMGMLGAIAYPPAPKPRQTLRLLMAIAAPNDQQQLKLKQEAEHLQHELKLQLDMLQNNMVGTLPEIRVTILEQPGREQLAQALEQGNYQIFHFAGHSELGAAGGQLYLVNRHTGLSEPMSGDDLAGLLVNNGIQMAVFNSCRGAYTANTNAHHNEGDRSLTEALVSQGVPAVLAMAEQIPDDVALTLTRLFYRNLKQDYPVDLSLSRARQGLLSAYSSQQLYWALPILYMHPEFDGYLTSGDRALDNPADSLVRIPQTLAVSTLAPSQSVSADAPTGLQSTGDGTPETNPLLDDADGDDADGIETGESTEVTAVDSSLDEVNQTLDLEISSADHESAQLTIHAGNLELDDVWSAADSDSEIASHELTAASPPLEPDHQPNAQDDSPQETYAAADISSDEAATANDASESEDSPAQAEELLAVHNAPDFGDTADLPDDFFLPDDDLNVFDEGLASDDETDLDETNLYEPGSDDDEHTWSLVEELESSETEDSQNLQSPTNGVDLHKSTGDRSTKSALTNGFSNNGSGLASDSDAFTPEDVQETAKPPASGWRKTTHELTEGNGVPPEEKDSVDARDQSQQDQSQQEEAIAQNSHRFEPQNEAAQSDTDLPSETSSQLNQASSRHLQVVQPSHELAVVDSEEDTEVQLNQHSRWRIKKWLALPLATVAGAAIVILGYNLVPPIDSVNAPDYEGPVDNLDNLNLDNLTNTQLVSYGIDRFNSDDLSAGQKAVDELFERGSVEEVQQVIDAAPDDIISDPLFNFLQGRLLWENFNQGSADADIDDVSGFWTFASSQANDPLYYNALGFALYRQNRFHDAINAWQNALEILESQGEAVLPLQDASSATSSVSDTIDVPDSKRISDFDALTAYAGIALALAQLSASTESQPYDSLSRAIRIQQMVLQSDSANFAPEALEQQWLWTDSTVQEWRILTQIRPQ